MGKRVGIIGYPIGHSISPIFQQAAFDHCSLDATYRTWEVETGSLPEFLHELRSPDTLGVNVTVPHKEAVIPHLDVVGDWASMAGAVNTIVNEEGKLTGYNTDGTGFLRALEEHGHFSTQGRRVLIIGAGGSAKGVALALARQGVTSITIANRTVERAQRLARLVGGHGVRSDAISLSSDGDATAKVAESCDLLVNCTTLGMKHGPAEDRSPLPARSIPSNILVYDLVYNPPETPLLREAAKSGAATLGGLAMLVYQGAASFELWTGNVAPVDVMMRAAEQALA